MGYIENKILGRDILSASGTANTTTYMRGDDSWGVIDQSSKVDKVSWSHAVGTVGTFNEESSIGTIQLGAVSGVDGSAMTASNTTSLPANTALSSSGAFTGTLTNLTSNTTTSFTVSVTDGTNTDTRTFSITNTADNDAPTWTTASGELAVAAGDGYSVQLSASDPEGGSVTYSVTAGSLPPGLTMSSAGLISGTATLLDGTVYNFTITVSDSVLTADRSFSIKSAPPPIQATGGTVTTYSGYKVHTFTSSGTFEVTEVPSGETIDFMVVAGGGSSGNGSTAAGGGAGGYRYFSNQTITTGSYSVVIGAGGSGPTSGSGQTAGNSGSTSSFNSVSATGGGYGNYGSNSGANGGSGGAKSGSGNAGGYSPVEGYGGGTNNGIVTSGGGGAGGIGHNYYGHGPGHGGPGINNSITGSSVGYAGGGAGGTYYNNGGYGSPHGGSFGGGGKVTYGVSGDSGDAGTGGGGGAPSSPGGDTGAGSGGSGVVIIRYAYN
jgi:hypothetical protein